MAPRRVTKLPPLRPQGAHRERHDFFNRNGQVTEEGELKLQSMEESCIYSGAQRKPQFLLYLENYVDKELHALDHKEPKYDKVKLQVHRDAFCAFIQAFKSYQPFLSAVKQEYENTLAHQDQQIEEMETLRSRLRAADEEGDRKIQAFREKQQDEIETLKKEIEMLKIIIQNQASKEEDTQAVVNRLQAELSDLYLQYRDECDARKLLIHQLNYLTQCSQKNEQSGQKSKEAADPDPVVLELALKVCRSDLTRVQEELSRFKAEHWDVVPRRDWDALEKTHGQTLQQLKTLREDFDVMKSEFDALLDVCRRDTLQREQHVTAELEDALQIVNDTHQVQSPTSENNTLPDHQVTSGQNEEDSPVASVLDTLDDCPPSQELDDPPEDTDMEHTKQ